ncbi:TonB-dependent receptor [Flavobacteriaceae bacterium]|nr:TonB-dependent receptor [Flavobacteriaceae bacterium]
MKTPGLFLILLLSATGLSAQNDTEQKVSDSLSLISLEEVQLIGIRANDDTPVTFTNITQKELAPRNLGQDIPILLNYLPAVVTTSDAGAGIGYTGIRVRGTDATRVNVTINGIPYNDAESQGTFWVNLPDFASSVDQIQLQRGVGTSTNGSAAFGASLNLETAALVDQPFVELSSSLGSFKSSKNSAQFSTGLLNEHFTFSGRLSQIQSDGYVDRARSDLKSYFFQGTYQDENTLVKALLFGGHEITYQSWYGLDAATLELDRRSNPAGAIFDLKGNATGFYDNQVDDYTQDHFQLHWNEHLNAFWNFSVGLNYTYGRGFYEEYNDLWYTQNISFGSETAYSYLQIPQNSTIDNAVTETENISQKWLDNQYYVLTFGLNYKDAETTLNFGGLASRYVGDHFGVLLWGQQLGETFPDQRFYENQGVKTEGSAFLKVSQKFGSGWNGFIDLQLRGITYEVSGVIAGPSDFKVTDDFLFFNPKAGLTYSFSDAQKIYLSYAKAQREPNRTDYENGTPKPEKLNDFELGWRVKKENIQAQANVYWMEYQDQLVLTGALDAVGAPIRQNVGKSRRVGLEVEVQWQLMDQLIWKPNVALSSNKNLDFYFKRDGVLEPLNNTNLAYSPNFIAGNALIFAPLTSFQIGLLSKYVGKQYMGNIDSENSLLEAYFVSDLSAVWTWQPKKWLDQIQWSVLINNIFNVEYESNGYFYTYDDDWSTPGQISTIEGAGYYPQAGINFFTGISLRF